MDLELLLDTLDEGNPVLRTDPTGAQHFFRFLQYCHPRHLGAREVSLIRNGEECRTSVRRDTKPTGQRLTQLTEEFVRNRVLEWLSRQGYGVISRVSTLAGHGEDIKVRRTGSRNYVIECKGVPPGKNPGKTQHGFLVSALGEIVQRVNHEKHYRYALALPVTYEAMARRRVRWVAAKRLGLEILFVDQAGKVRRVSWRDLKPKPG